MSPLPRYPYNSKLFEPQRSHLWIVDFSAVPLFTNGAIINQTNYGTVPIANSIPLKLQYQARGTTLPERTLGTITDGFMNQQTNYAEFESQAGRTWTCTFLEFYDTVNIRDIFNQWMNVIHNKETGEQSHKVVYAWDLFIKKHEMDGTIFRTFRLVNAFPTTLGPETLTHPDTGVGGKITFDVTFTYDYYKQEE